VSRKLKICGNFLPCVLVQCYILAKLQGSLYANLKKSMTNFLKIFALAHYSKLIYSQRDTFPYNGWVSHTDGQKSPALSFAFELTSEFHTTIKSEFDFFAIKRFLCILHLSWSKRISTVV